MRWQALFADLEGQLEAADQDEHAAEIRDRSRRESALVSTVDRLRGALGQQLVVAVYGAGPMNGPLLDAGPDWLLLEQAGHREALVPLSAVLSIAGLGRRSQAPGSEGQLGARLDLRWALRGLARSRVGLQVVLRDGVLLAGTLDRVGADHVELAEHAAGEARRAQAVQGVRLVPLAALALLRQL